MLSVYGSALDILRMRRLGGKAGEVRAEDLWDVDQELERSFGDFTDAKSKQTIAGAFRDGGADRTVEELQHRVEKAREDLATALDEEFANVLEGGDIDRACTLASGRWSLAYDILLLGQRWNHLHLELAEGRSKNAEKHGPQELQRVNKALMDYMQQLSDYTGPLSTRSQSCLRAEVNTWCAQLRGTEHKLQVKHQEKEEQKQKAMDAREREVTERFLAVLTPKVHTPMPKDEDPAEAAYVALQVPPEVRDRAREEAVFASDCRGRLLATGVIPGIDVPKGYNEPGFVPDFHYYCTLCSKPLDYWEQLPEHLDEAGHQSWVKYLRECAQGAYEVYLEQNEKGYNEPVILSSSKKAFSCEACGIESGPWWEVKRHKTTWKHIGKAKWHQKMKAKEAVKAAARKAKQDEERKTQWLQQQQKLQEQQSRARSSRVRDKNEFHEFLLEQCDL